MSECKSYVLIMELYQQEFLGCLPRLQIQVTEATLEANITQSIGLDFRQECSHVWRMIGRQLGLTGSVRGGNQPPTLMFSLSLFSTFTCSINAGSPHASLVFIFSFSLPLLHQSISNTNKMPARPLYRTAVTACIKNIRGKSIHVLPNCSPTRSNIT